MRNSGYMLRLIRKRPLLTTLVALLIGGILFALDIRFKGLIYRTMYGVTGETGVFQQINGMGSYLSNFTRRTPQLDDGSAITIRLDNPMGINTFLEQEPEIAKRERQLQMIADAGFGMIRQQFRWDDIEISGRGNFTDARNDLNGDTRPDAISAWDKYDNIVTLAEKYNIQITARLGSPPVWSQPPGALAGFAPPADLNDFANYAAAVAQRYKGRIRYYQVWNEPNIYPEWGENIVDPEAYTELLCTTYATIKDIDPDAIIISAALAPNVELNGRDFSDLIYLQRMYDAGAGDCFDILGMQGYGLFSGPTDRRMRPTTTNYSRIEWIRDLMIANGDIAKPIWISEMAWNPVPNDPTIADLDRFGQTDDATAAQYAVDAYERARTEWPFVGVINYWFFKRPDESEKNQSWYYFRAVDPDFTPRPVYNALKEYAAVRKYRR